MSGYKHKCRTVPLAKMIVNPKGLVKPLCNTCKMSDCGNPIELQEVSILGVTEKMRCWCSGNNVSIVVQCEGYNS